MSERPICQVRGITITPVCSIGYPRWYVEEKNPEMSYGLLMEFVVDGQLYEVRDTDPKYRLR